MSSEDGKRTLDTGPDAPGEHVDTIVGRYLERLIRGETVEPEEVLHAHPRLGAVILRDLETFLDYVPGPQLQPGPELGTLGDYILRRQIGRGGMGVVYEAWENSMERRVALKVLPSGIAADSKACVRFVREAQAAGKLAHPNVVPVYFMGVKEQTPFYAMEYVEGETLAQVLGRLKEAEPETETPFGKKDSIVYFGKLADAFADVADGLQHAHSKGVVHRDIKPSNLILDGEGRLRILDFGLARLDGEESLTLSGDVVGTPSYMSPEQAQRHKIPIDHRTDTYSLGATLYELLVWNPPFRGRDHQDTLSQIITREPVEPRKLNARIPRDMETIVLRSLQKDPTDRYATAEALGQDLRRFMRGDPVEARRQTAWERFSRRLWRHRVATAAAVLLFLAGMVGLAASNMLIDRARDTAESERDIARENLYVAHMWVALQDWEAGNMSRLWEVLDAHAPAPGESDLRGWEWYYLKQLCHSEVFTLHHSGTVRSVAWSPDGLWIASGSIDGTVKIWNAATGAEIVDLRHPPKGPKARFNYLPLAWSPECERLATAATDGTVKTWDVASGRELLTLVGQKGFVMTVAWSPDGQRLASGGEEGLLKVWNAGTGADELTVQSPHIWSLAWSPDGRQLAGGTNTEGLIVLWDAASGHERLRIEAHKGAVYTVAWSSDGRWLASGGADQSIKLWDPRTGEELLEVHGHRGGISSVAWRPEGEQLASASQDGMVKLWDMTNGEELRSLRGHSDIVESVTWSPDGQRLASASRDRTVKIWDASAEPEALTGRGGARLAWSPDGVLLALEGETDGTVVVLNVASGQEQMSFNGGDSGMCSVAWSPDGKRLAAAREDGGVSAWKCETGAEIFGIQAVREGQARSVAWSPDSLLLATGGGDAVLTGGGDAKVKVWNAATGLLVVKLKGHMNVVGSVAWSPDGRRLASSDWNQAVKVWDVDTWAEMHHLERHPSPGWAADGQYSIAWSPGGDRLAAASGYGWLIIWDAVTAEELVRTRSNSSLLRSVAWSPDGRRLATGSQDHTVKIWDPAGYELLTLRGHSSNVNTVAWSPDGESLATTDRQSVRIWDASAAYEAETLTPK